MHGMQRELQAYDKKQGMNNLVKAAEYLHSAIEIFESAGMTEKADQVLKILGKIVLADKKDDDSCPADDNEVMHKSKKDKEFYEKMLKWIENPNAPVDPENIQPGEEIEMQSVMQPPSPRPGDTLEFTSLQEPKQLPPGEDLVFRSIAQELGLIDDNDAGESKPRKPKDPTKVPNGHTHGLTSEKMVKNLENHGTVFNMADDGNVDVPQPDTFGDDYRRYMEMLSRQKRKKLTEEDIDPDLVGLIELDKGEADDLLDLEIGEKPVEVMDSGLGKTFEDSD